MMIRWTEGVLNDFDRVNQGGKTMSNDANSSLWIAWESKFLVW